MTKKFHHGNVQRMVGFFMIAIILLLLGLGFFSGFVAFLIALALVAVSFVTGAITAAAITVTRRRIPVFEIPIVIVNTDEIDMSVDN